MFTVLALIFGVFWGSYFSWLLKKAKGYISRETLLRVMKYAHIATALATVNAVLFHLREIALRTASFLSDHLGVWIIRYAGEPLHFIAGYLGTIAKSLFDYAALAHPVHPALQAMALLVFTQMVVFEVLSRDIKKTPQ